MGKYDFDLELVGQNSLLLILEQIKKGSVVLEFGPANGRLTKFLKESLDCLIYLVEIDEEAGRQALQYAEDLVIGDAEDYAWLERYQDIRFDNILFADVLEHLRDPRKLLAVSKRLLKEEGSIILSVPNLAHNAVVINLLNNEFEYRDIGLLDDTHTHFFTKNSLEKMVAQAGLAPVKRFATYVKTNECEIEASVEAVQGISAEFWNHRPYGEVYQYIYELKKNNGLIEKEENYLKKSISGSSVTLYLDGENGYDEEKSIRQRIQNLSGRNCYTVPFPEPQRQIRFDPMECCGAVLVQDLAALCPGGEKKLRIISHNAAFQLGDFYVFECSDPQFLLELDSGETMEEVKLEIECFLLGDQEKIQQLLRILIRLQREEAARPHIERLEADAEKQDQLIEDLEKQVCKLSQALEDNRRYIESFKQLLVEKDKVIEEQSNFKQLLAEKERMIDEIYHSKTWRINRFICKLLGRR